MNIDTLYVYRILPKLDMTINNYSLQNNFSVPFFCTFSILYFKFRVSHCISHNWKRTDVNFVYNKLLVKLLIQIFICRLYEIHTANSLGNIWRNHFLFEIIIAASISIIYSLYRNVCAWAYANDVYR